MAVMAAPGSHPAQPGVSGIAAAQLPFDGMVDEDPVDARQFRRQPDQCGVAGGPARRVDAAFVGQDQGGNATSSRARPSGPASGGAPAKYRHPARPDGWNGHRASDRHAAGRDRLSKGWGSLRLWPAWPGREATRSGPGGPNCGCGRAVRPANPARPAAAPRPRRSAEAGLAGDPRRANGGLRHRGPGHPLRSRAPHRASARSRARAAARIRSAARRC